MSIGHWKEQRYVAGRTRTARAKSFKSKEKAEEYAKKMKLDKYKVVQLSHGLSKKFKVVEE